MEGARRNMKKKAWRTALVFLLLAFLVQAVFSLFGTTSMLERTFPFYQRLIAKKIVCGDNSFTDYFALRRRASGVSVIVCGFDFSCEESYTLLTDLITALKHDTDIGTVLFDVDTMQKTVAKAVAAGGAQRETNLYKLRQNTDYVDSFYSFLGELGDLNAKYPPQKQMAVAVLALPPRDGTSARAEALSAAARAYRLDTGRAVLVLAELEEVQKGSPLFVCNDAQLALQILPRETAISGETKLFLAERDRLSLFDRLYAIASTRSTGYRPVAHYSEEHLTELFFLIENPTRGTHTAPEPIAQNTEGES